MDGGKKQDAQTNKKQDHLMTKFPHHQGIHASEGGSSITFKIQLSDNPRGYNIFSTLITKQK